ncbi:hypothetical protein [Pseudomonas sp. KCJK8993]|uniref:hypothetical protein n=1 Tax=Pseudomonas sp. KCJK8993 TaxID=3344565 RepID=UPI003905EE83
MRIGDLASARTGNRDTLRVYEQRNAQPDHAVARLLQGKLDLTETRLNERDHLRRELQQGSAGLSTESVIFIHQGA